MDKAQDLNWNWHLYGGPRDFSKGPQGSHCNPNVWIWEVVTKEPLNVEINAI
jgi:hypothetical protein